MNEKTCKSPKCSLSEMNSSNLQMINSCRFGLSSLLPFTLVLIMSNPTLLQPGVLISPTLTYYHLPPLPLLFSLVSCLPKEQSACHGDGDETGFHPGKNSCEHQNIESSYISFSLSNFKPASVWDEFRISCLEKRNDSSSSTWNIRTYLDA